MKPSLTAWEAKEWGWQTSIETNEWTKEWQEKRQIAENPNTTGEVLARFANELECAWANREVHNLWHHFTIADAIAAHPNAPLNTIIYLLKSSIDSCPHAFCQNPIAPFVVLEMPDFWERLNEFECERLLCEESLPRSVASTLTQHTSGTVAQAANLHISLLGEMIAPNVGVAALNEFWRMVCGQLDQKEYPKHGFTGKEWRQELVEMELAPTWAADQQRYRKTVGKFHHASKLRRKVVPYHSLCWAAISSVARMHRFDHHAYIRQAIIAEIGEQVWDVPDFVVFAGNLHGALDLEYLRRSGRSREWKNRLNAALRLPLSSVPFVDDLWNRSPLDLINHLARDGNRFVRWAAQTRLADPDFVFTWHEDAD